MSMPRFGQRSDPRAAPDCPRHPGARSVDYCKRCNRPMCPSCVVPTEVRSICVDCAKSSRGRRSARLGSAAAFLRSSGAPVTVVLIGACVLMYLLVLVVPPVQSLFMLVPAWVGPRPWIVVTSAFLHSGFLHVFFNMLTLYWVGSVVERAIGHWRYGAVCLISALGGSALVMLWCFVQPSTFFAGMVGASGAVFGLFGAVFVLQRLSGSSTAPILILLGINLVYGFANPGVSWQAHIGGFLAGAAATWALLRTSGRPGGTLAPRAKQIAVCVAMAAAMAALCAVSYWGVPALYA